MHHVLRSTAFTATAVVLALPLAAGFWWFTQAEQPLLATLCGVVYMATPLVTAVGFARRDGVAVRDALGLQLSLGRRWLPAWWMPLAIGLVAMGLTFLMPGVSFDPGMGGLLARFDGPTRALAEAQLQELPGPALLIPVSLLQAAIAGTTINAVAALGEEAGWRGFLHRELAPLGFWPRVGVTGVLWGLWHAPLILQGYNYPQHPVVGVLFMVAMCVGLSGPMAWLRERTGSTVAAAVFHGTFNGVAGLPLLYAVGGNDLTNGVTGLAGLLTLLLANGLLWARMRSEGVVE